MLEEFDQDSQADTREETQETPPSSMSRQETGLERKSGRRALSPRQRAVISNPDIRFILDEVVEVAGGRDKLIEGFELVCPEGLVEAVKRLSAWNFLHPKAPMTEGLRAAGLSFKQLMGMYKDVVIAPLQLQAQMHLAQGMPSVVKQTMKEAGAVWKKCVECGGKGKVPERECDNCAGLGRDDESGQTCTKCYGRKRLPGYVCGTCGGRGALEMRANMESRKLAFEAAGLTGKGREVNVAVQTNVTVPPMEDVARSLPAFDVEVEGV